MSGRGQGSLRAKGKQQKSHTGRTSDRLGQSPKVKKEKGNPHLINKQTKGEESLPRLSGVEDQTPQREKSQDRAKKKVLTSTAQES